jgi:hypothetical protein
MILQKILISLKLFMFQNSIPCGLIKESNSGIKKVNIM